MEQIILKRMGGSPDKPTMGTFTYNNTTVASLEPSRNAVVHPTHPCIKAGVYDVIIDFSNAFNRDMPHVLNVPNRDGIRIHTGNWEKDSLGCILLGTSATCDAVEHSHDAWNPFFAWLQEVGKAQITIIDP